MKVLVVSPQPFYEERGTPIAVRMLVEALAGCRHEVDLLVYHCGQSIELPGVRVIRAPAPLGIKHVPIGISWRKLVCDLAVIWRFWQLLRKQSYDVVHAVEEAVFPAVVLKRWHRYQVVYDMDSLMSQQLTDKWKVLRPLASVLSGFEKYAIGHCSAVLAVCDDLAESVRSMVPEASVRVLTDVPLSATRSKSVANAIPVSIRDEDSLIALYVGNLEQYQGVERLIHAMAYVPEQIPVSLVIVGGNEVQIEAYRRLVAASQRHRVKFLGHRPLHELDSLLSQADIVVSPRTGGVNTPMKIYSYMQCGKPILATAIRAHVQVLDTECAVLVDATPEALAAGLVELARDPERRRRLGKAAARRVAEKHSPHGFRNVLSQTYEKLLRTEGAELS